MDHYITVTPTGAKLAILAGACNPPARAHVAMAESGVSGVDEVLFALPGAFPHKGYTGWEFETRLALLRAALAGNPRFSLDSTEGGLFVEIAEEARSVYGAGTELFLLCRRDTAVRIVGWADRDGDRIQQQLESFKLLVGRRCGEYEPPAGIRNRLRLVYLP